VSLLLLLACRGGADTAPVIVDYTDVLTVLAEDFALAHYTSFSQRAGELSQAAAALCKEPTEPTLTAAREAWWSARTPWKNAEIINFGPVVEYPERLGPKLDDWPANDAAIEALVLSDDALDFSLMGSATRGLPVVEYLLWQGGEEALSMLAETPRRCAILSGAAADVHDNAVLLVDLWQNTWIPQVTVPSSVEDGFYETQQEVLDEWVNRMVFTVENIRAEKLGKPIGDCSGGEPQPDTIESRLSGRSLTDALDALDGVQGLWETGVRGLVDDDPALVDSIDALLVESRSRLAAVPEPLEDTAALQPEVIGDVQEALLALQVAIQVDLLQALGVTPAFNDNDGD
jgi:predicted lipoprotein